MSGEKETVRWTISASERAGARARTANSDMEALRAYFDTNGDGKLTAADAAFAQFRVLVTNADGSKVVKTLAQLGITEINLTEDATRIVLPDGPVIEGQTTFNESQNNPEIAWRETGCYKFERLAKWIRRESIILTSKLAGIWSELFGLRETVCKGCEPMKLIVVRMIAAAISSLPGLGAFATVPGLITGEVAKASELRQVIAQCHIEDKYTPVGELIKMRYHTLFRFKSNCSTGEFGKLCPTIIIDNSDRECSELFFSGDYFVETSVARAKITLGPGGDIPNSVLYSATPVISMATDTVAGNLVIFEVGDDVFVVSGGKAK